MPETIHVMLTDYGNFGWGISSPQLPELIGGRDIVEELRADLDELLVFGGAERGSPFVIHLQKYLVLDNGDELVIRIAQDEKFKERWEAGLRLTAALRVAGQITSMLNVPRRPTGEVLFICAEASDTLGWVSAQLNAHDASCLVVSIAEDLIRTQFIGHGEGTDATEDWARTTDMGWTDSTTISEIMKAQDSGRVARVVYA
jgi:hypothetical protein